jgi:hypothetical protein
MLSQREAAQRSNHSAKALRQALDDHVLAANAAGKFEERELARFVAWLGTCRLAGCNEPARYPSFCCSRGHAVSVAKSTTERRPCARPGCNVIFRPRPDQLRQGQGECCSRKCAQVLRRQREEAAGKLKGKRVVCACGCGESRLVYPSQLASPILGATTFPAYRYLNAGHWARHRWTNGIALKDNVYGFYSSGQWTLKAVRRQHGRWASLKAGRPKTVTNLEAVEGVLRLKASNPRLGERSLAERAGVSRRRVRDILAEHM